ncbi:ABC-type transport system, permease and ATPse components [Alteracholeplasma palmae J233]|uniref:ABC-type transport system, permease and ATPse components n=1 Tax=Alteracholeplasma palmae (strain ATCC 49389 / J233) TaxID=1318466 RepID=U4KLF7_ALTPJ|nr:ABC transporter ATP-binding protein [Alteracholeplasma palmae]CCV64769.1 ABC-type transport system, permease and ATPse components [Alteracholeplasma palmae J233]
MNQQEKEDVVKKISLGVWKKIFNIVLKEKKKIIILVILATLLAAMEAVIPVLNTYAIDEFVDAGKFDTLIPYIIVNVIFAIAFGLIVWGFIRQGSIIESNVNYELRRQAFNNLQKLSFSYFDLTPQGWIMARMTSDSKRLANVISWSLLDLVWSVFSMILTLVVLFIYSYKLALIVLASVPVMLAVAFIYKKFILKNHRLARKYNSDLTAKYSESFLGAKTTKSLVIEKENLDEFVNVSNKMKKSSIKAVSTSALMSSSLLIISYLTVALVMYTGSLEVINNTIKISVLFLFIRSTTSFFDPIMQLTNVLSSIQQAQASAERIVELIEEKPAITDTQEVTEKYGSLFHDKKENWEDLKETIEFKNVGFQYKENETILEDFNLKIKAGQSVALVGHTGSGKTTLVNLISRFYEPTKGELLIDGKEYRERSIHWLHSKLGYVLQSPHLFSTTIKENIKYGKLDATDEEVISASKAIGAHEFIMKLENGYDTFVGEGGNLLSLGQKQLISFARAIIADPKILILDEATSSIDSEAEQIIQEATQTLLKNRTSLIVAHRLSTIVHSDLIVMLEMGKIIEIGTHNELLKKRGSYFDLYKNQFMQEKENSYNLI